MRREIVETRHLHRKVQEGSQFEFGSASGAEFPNQNSSSLTHQSLQNYGDITQSSKAEIAAQQHGSATGM